MLFDEKDLSVFENNDSRVYFKEILQSYYSQNYRATVVLLYSFVIYDLFTKLQIMASEGDKKAATKLKEVNEMIADDEKYSLVESSVIQFFKENCPLYFDRFDEDIDYLKNCRNKCAHLKVDDSSLFVPRDYHAKMLICSMYDNILSVKAPFLMDIFQSAQSDIETYTSSSELIEGKPEEAIISAIRNKYLKRLTYDSIKKSYKTFLRLLFLSNDDECKKNIKGLYVFTYALTDYILKENYAVLNEEDVKNQFLRINAEVVEEDSNRRGALIFLSTTFPIIMDIIRENDALFSCLSGYVLAKPHGLKYYRAFYPRSKDSAYQYFLNHADCYSPAASETIYNGLKNCDDFNIDEFVKKMASAIPVFDGFAIADRFMNFFIAHITEISKEAITETMKIYNENGQCTRRGRHALDMDEIKEYLS